MQTNIQNIKTICPKNREKVSRTAKLATICNCSESMVRYVLKGERNPDTELATKIQVACQLLDENENALLNEVKRRIQF